MLTFNFNDSRFLPMETKQCIKCKGTGRVPALVGAEMMAKREKLRLTQRAVAAQMGIESAHLSRLEHDKNPWTKQRVEDFNAALAALRRQQ